MPKTAVKTAVEAGGVRTRSKGKTTAHTGPRTRVPQEHGGALLAGGVHGNHGGTGRPPNELRLWCQELLASTKVRAQVVAIMGNGDHPAFAAMYKAIAERAYGKPVQPIEKDVQKRIEIRVRHE